MSILKALCLGVTLSIVTFSGVRAACSPSLGAEIVSAERVIDSLRPDKAGQMRVFAADGSEYTAGQAMWMKGQLKLINQACASGDEASAQAHLRVVADLIKAHERDS